MRRVPANASEVASQGPYCDRLPVNITRRINHLRLGYLLELGDKLGDRVIPGLVACCYEV